MVKQKKVTVNNSMQENYVYYLTEKTGSNFHPEFKPELTPKEMLELGIFGGRYLNSAKEEYPKDWFEKAKLSGVKNIELNFFGVDASKPINYWREKGWMNFQDPRGWFEWYCRYYRGRRSEDDVRQIKRWKQMKRHIAQLEKNCEKGNWYCRKKQRQALLHWAYDSRLM